MAMQKVKAYLLFLITGICLGLCAVLFNNLNTCSLQQVAEKASAEISKKALQGKAALSQLNTANYSNKITELYRLYQQKNIGVYYFRGDSLVFWNNAQVPVERDPKIFKDHEGLVKLRQGYYLYVKSQQGSQTGIALCLVKPLYELQNNYLKNNFAGWTKIPGDVQLDLSASAPGNAVKLNGKEIFSLQGSENYYTPEWAANVALVIFMAGFLLILVALLLLLKQGIKPLQFILIVALVVLLKGLMLYYKWPAFFYKSILYDVHIFGDAQSLISFYLGDILLNAFVLLFLSAACHIYFKWSNRKITRTVYIFLLAALAFFIVSQFNKTVTSLVTNSTLNFDFLSIFTIKIPAFIGVLALAVYTLALYVTVNKLILFFYTTAWLGFLKFLLIIGVICALQRIYFHNTNAFECLWFLLFSLSLFILVKFNYSKNSLGLGFQVLLMSVITSVLLNFYIEKNQKQGLDNLSYDLSEQHDAILESEFASIPAKIASDKKLAVILFFLPNNKKEVEQFLKQKYFSEYFNRYNIDFSLFDESCNPMLSPKQAVLMDEGFFDNQIRYNSDSTVVPGLFFVKNFKNNSGYIGKIKINDKSLYVFLEPKQFEELGSFPDLLLDQSQQKQEVFKSFSYAVYRAGQNTSRYGDFNYPFFILDSAALAKSNPDFKHYYFQNERSVQIISQRNKTATDKFTFNSYIFLFFSIISFVCCFIYMLVFTAQFKTPSLTRRIQTIIIMLLLLVMSGVGVTSGNLVAGQFESDNKQQLQEKTEIIINELATQFKPEEFFDESQKEIVNLKLNEYAHLFNTVISLFDKSGYLYNTSQPRLYDLGLAASLANPKAFWNLRQNKSSAENVVESAGTLNYFSLYTPLYNSKQELIGFVNLPYFARQSDLVNELSGIISALINVYVILFVISILAGLILSGYITKPLRLIKQQIANISLGRENEKINWQSNDEIGRLVSEYNQMLVKLENSASLLAQSERESAWREMAKQVAHEIKNPLTPMKLNLQYLQHLMNNNSDDFKEKFGRTSAGIIEQIDSLANIANAFSNFAKLPGAELQAINLGEIIGSAVLIFENQKNIAIHNHIREDNLWVLGDKDQCLRVFNNILKNAVQALDEVANPAIEISASYHDEQVVVAISDNGCGIADDLKPSIFSPNFTTKTTGSGLGLAMVKNIMQGFGGKIWFTSEKEKGTTFYLEFTRSSAEKGNL